MAYYSLGDFQRAIEYHEKDLSIAKEVGDRAGEGSAHFNLGISHFDSGSVNEGVAHFRCSVDAFDTIRANCSSEDLWGTSVSKLREDANTYLWRVLIRLQQTDESLNTAEQGRAQTMLDDLQMKYGLTSLLPGLNEFEKEATQMSRKISDLTVFLALENEAINIWVLG